MPALGAWSRFGVPHRLHLEPVCVSSELDIIPLALSSSEDTHTLRVCGVLCQGSGGWA